MNSLEAAFLVTIKFETMITPSEWKEYHGYVQKLVGAIQDETAIILQPNES
jgi:hypothetical protein